MTGERNTVDPIPDPLKCNTERDEYCEKEVHRGTDDRIGEIRTRVSCGMVTPTETVGINLVVETGGRVEV